MTANRSKIPTRWVGLSFVATILNATPAFAQAQDSDDPFARRAAAPVARPAAHPAAEPALRPSTLPAAPTLQPTGAAPAPSAMPPAAYPQPYPPPAPVVDEARRAQLSEPEGPVLSWEPLRFAIAADGRVLWPRQNGAKRLANGRAQDTSGVSLQADVLRASDGLALCLDLDWTRATSSSSQVGPDQLSSGLSEQLETNLFELGAQARYYLFAWLAPYARLAGGLGWDSLNVGVMHDRQWFGQATAGAGILLRTPGLRLWQGRFSPLLGLVGTVEGGYAVGTGSDFSVQASLPTSSQDPIPVSRVALGHVGRSAPYLRITLGLAF